MMPEDMPPKIIVLTETTDLDITIHTAPALVEVKTLCSEYTSELGMFTIDTIEEKKVGNGMLDITLHLKKVVK